MSDTPNPCDLPLDDLVAHLDGELGQAASARVTEHLAACAPCRRESELLGRAGAALDALPSTSPSAGFADRVLAATRTVPVARAAAVQPAVRGRLVRLWPAAAVAAALLAAFLLNRPGANDAPMDGGNEVANEMTDDELEAIAADLPLLANFDALQSDDDPASLIALIENLDLLESIETQSLDDLLADAGSGR